MELVALLALFGVVLAVMSIVPCILMVHDLNVDKRTKGKAGFCQMVFNMSKVLLQLVLRTVTQGDAIISQDCPNA